jgi:hypothetical protein
MVFRPLKAPISDRDINVILVYPLPSDNHVLVYVKLKEQSFFLISAVNGQMEEGGISDRLDRLSLIPLYGGSYRRRDFLTAGAESLS